MVCRPARQNPGSDLENYVLKPLYSFAGAGVKINITEEDITSIEDPDNYYICRRK